LFLLFFPEGNVLLEELNDGLSISEGLLINIVDLFESIRECLFSKGAGFLVVVHNLVVEYGEVKSKSKSDWVAGIELFGRIVGMLIILESSILNLLEFVWR